MAVWISRVPSRLCLVSDFPWEIRHNPEGQRGTSVANYGEAAPLHTPLPPPEAGIPRIITPHFPDHTAGASTSHVVEPVLNHISKSSASLWTRGPGQHIAAISISLWALTAPNQIAAVSIRFQTETRRGGHS